MSKATDPKGTKGDKTQAGQQGQSAQDNVRESIKYRRRAQEAERRCAVLEAEVQRLRQSSNSEAETLQTTLEQSRLKIDELTSRLGELASERDLDRALVRAGAVDVEAAAAVARQRLASNPQPPEDIDEFARALLEEKPFLKAAPKTTFSPLGKSTQSAKPAGETRNTILKNLAETASKTGRTQDILSYMRLRRAAT